MGFRAGNEVLVDGVAAAVSSWSANSIVAVAPAESAFATKPAGPVNVEVVDLETGGTTVMSGVLSYSASIAPDQLAIVAAPPGVVGVGSVVAFSVRAVQGDGVTPVAGVPVTFSVATGGAQFAGCAASCVVLTDANGIASASVVPTTFGSVTVQATAVGSVQAATFLAVARSITAVQPVEYVAAGATVGWTPQVSVLQNGAPVAGIAVQWTGTAGLSPSSGSSLANALGVAAMPVAAGPLAAGVQVGGQVCAWTTVCANFAALGVDPSAWRLVVMSGAGQTVIVFGEHVCASGCDGDRCQRRSGRGRGGCGAPGGGCGGDGVSGARAVSGCAYACNLDHKRYFRREWAGKRRSDEDCGDGRGDEYCRGGGYAGLCFVLGKPAALSGGCPGIGAAQTRICRNVISWIRKDCDPQVWA